MVEPVLCPEDEETAAEKVSCRNKSCVNQVGLRSLMNRAYLMLAMIYDTSGVRSRPVHLRTVYSSAANSTTVKVVPSPSFESTQILPPWLSTIDFTIERPRPVPGMSSGMLLARKNLSNR